MDLKQRLAALRQQTGHACIAERIQRYRVGPPPARACRPVDASALAERLGGSLRAGGVIRIERRVALDDVHGARCLARVLDDHGALPEARGLDPGRLVFVDTETSGLAGGTGTVVFLLGLARIEDGALQIRQYLLTGFAGEAVLLTESAKWLGNDDTLVSFNGKCFDVPLLAARCRLAGVADPFSTRGHLDLLHPTRRAFNRYWPDCRLGTAEQRLLGFARTDDLPGSEAPQAWLDLLRRGDATRMPGIARHNHRDLVSLAALLPALVDAHAVPAEHGADALAVARAHLARDDEARARAVLTAARARLDSGALLELARLHRRNGDWNAACIIWERLAEKGSLESIERLAKYYEHVRGDHAVAFDYARRLPLGGVHDSRRQRLRRKLEKLGKLGSDHRSC
ncbi:MAG: hypothetical protein GWO16_01805 [Gammaproteobacteria bacterium]|nr:hypothetical protein [Gammaproteobacteria bacterium]NIR28450.1 hypothetical protein [Gammaproteobacteria bacterium]NIR96896.1 hypothetical protein [Gammaproteobacteria bacterium]NIT62597.1 hypothetical protein [Gammaproteobacteria bacterium]NIV19554.1 hypothetical protein [Gammaproteobacteria bacterium]